MRLHRFPQDKSLFVDANILIHHFLGLSSTCTELIRRSEAREIRALTATHIIAEIRHRLMLAEAIQRRGLTTRNVLRYLKKHPDFVRTLTRSTEAVAALPRLHIRVLPVTHDLVLRSLRISERYGLMTNDALTVSVMSEHGLRHLATNDRDFTRVPMLTLWYP